MKRACALAAIALALPFAAMCAAAFAQALQPIPPLEARVTDTTGTLTAAQQASLEQKLADFEKRKGAQLALLMVPTTEPEDIAQYGIRVVEAWQLGRAEPDDGALLLVAKDDRRLRIEVGYGLEGVLTDATSRRIIAETITPLFRQGDFYGGVDAGLDQMMRVVDGEPLPPPDERWQGRGSGGGSQMLLLAVFGVFFISGILRRLFGRGIGSLMIGGVTGGIVYLVLSALGVALLAGTMALIFSLFLSAMSGSTWSSLPRQGGWGGGFGGGGFGGGGFGGGGFGGGGGGFGGGGASGSW